VKGCLEVPVTLTVEGLYEAFLLSQGFGYGSPLYRSVITILFPLEGLGLFFYYQALLF